MKHLIVIAAGLGYEDLDRRGLKKMAGLEFRPAESVFPAVTCVAQATFRTAAAPCDHGMVSNGFFSRKLMRPSFWEQSATLVTGPLIWDAARDTAKAMTALNLKNVYLLGTSQGGRIAMAIAIKQPELVEKLVLASTSARLGQDQYALFDRWISFAESGDALGLYMSFGETLYPEYMLEDFKQMLIDEAKTVTTDELRRFVIILSEGKQVFDPTNQLKEIACPVLVIGGIDDQVMGSDAGLYIAKHLAPQKDVVLQLYDGYGHMPYDLAPDFKERLKQFFLS